MSGSYQWKKTEIDAAEVINTQRNPFSGSNGGMSASDSIHDRLFLEAKTREKHPTMQLWRETQALAKVEGKTPVLVFRENGQKEVLWIIEEKDLFKLLQDVDLSLVDKRFPQGTTIHKLVETSSSENRSLYDLKEMLTIELKKTIREKVITDDALEAVKSYAALLSMIDTLIDYSKDEEE